MPEFLYKQSWSDGLCAGSIESDPIDYAWRISNLLQYPQLRSGDSTGLLDFARMLAHRPVNNSEFFKDLQGKFTFVVLAKFYCLCWKSVDYGLPFILKHILYSAYIFGKQKGMINDCDESSSDIVRLNPIKFGSEIQTRRFTQAFSPSSSNCPLAIAKPVESNIHSTQHVSFLP